MSGALIQNVLFAITILTLLFNIYRSYSKPQQSLEVADIRFEDEIKQLKKSVAEIRETHIKNVEQDIKMLNSAIQDLSKTVVKLTTIIDERIPKANLQSS